MIILYAELGTPDFQRFHQALTSKVNEGSAAYVLRHYVAVGVHTHKYCYSTFNIIVDKLKLVYPLTQVPQQTICALFKKMSCSHPTETSLNYIQVQYEYVKQWMQLVVLKMGAEWVIQLENHFIKQAVYYLSPLLQQTIPDVHICEHMAK